MSTLLPSKGQLLWILQLATETMEENETHVANLCRKELVKVLIEGKADISMKDKDVKTAKDYAKYMENNPRYREAIVKLTQFLEESETKNNN